MFELNCLYGLYERGAQQYGAHPLFRFNRVKEEMVTVNYDEYLTFLQKI